MFAPTSGSSDNLFEESANRVRALNEQILQASRKSGSAFLDAYEQSLKGIADYEQKAAESTQVDVLATLLKAQADLIREVGKATTASARELLK